MCLNHSLQHVLDLDDGPSPQMTTSAIRPRYPIRNCKYASQIIRRVPPLCSQPAVIVVQPPDHSANVEGSVDRVEDVGCAGYSSAIGNHSAINDGAKEFRAFFEAEGFEAATNGVKEDVTGGFELKKGGQWRPFLGLCQGGTNSEIRIDLIVVDVASHVLDLWVKFPYGGGSRSARSQSSHGGKRFSRRIWL